MQVLLVADCAHQLATSIDLAIPGKAIETMTYQTNFEIQSETTDRKQIALGRRGSDYERTRLAIRWDNAPTSPGAWRVFYFQLRCWNRVKAAPSNRSVGSLFAAHDRLEARAHLCAHIPARFGGLVGYAMHVKRAKGVAAAQALLAAHSG